MRRILSLVEYLKNHSINLFRRSRKVSALALREERLDRKQAEFNELYRLKPRTVEEWIDYSDGGTLHPKLEPTLYRMNENGDMEQINND